MADYTACIQRCRPRISAGSSTARGPTTAGQSMTVEHGSDFLRRMVLVSGKIHFAVAHLADFREFAFEVIFHHFSNGIQLHSNFFYLVSSGFLPTVRASRQLLSCACKISSVHLEFSLLHLIDSEIASPRRQRPCRSATGPRKTTTPCMRCW